MERFPALNLILRFGAFGSIVMALLMAAGLADLLFIRYGWFALPFALFAGGVAYVVFRAFVELVTLVTEMLVPR